MVAGAGHYFDVRFWPAALPGVVAVSGNAEGYQSGGPFHREWVDLAAEFCVTTTVISDSVYGPSCGSSMSTAAVSGALGLLRSVAPHAAPEALVAALEATATPEPDYARAGMMRVDLAMDVLVAAQERLEVDGRGARLPAVDGRAGTAAVWNLLAEPGPAQGCDRCVLLARDDDPRTRSPRRRCARRRVRACWSPTRAVCRRRRATRSAVGGPRT